MATNHGPRNAMFENETCRLETFVYWRNNDNSCQLPTVDLLCKAGFFFQVDTGSIRCFYCDVRITCWRADDDPWVKHARCCPSCNFLLQCKGASFVEHITKDWQTRRMPKHLNMIQSERRYQTFEKHSWSENSTTLSTQNLVNAGFFYRGQDDLVTCYYCDGDIHHWEPDDNPFTKHALYFPECNFVQKMKPNTNLSTEDDSRKMNEIPQNLQQDEDIADELKFLTQENNKLIEKRICAVCKQKERSMLYIPCGHRRACEQCADTQDICDHCETKISNTIKILHQ